ncbi:MAG: type II toxin-antitoxin system RelE/ParE family toxin [Verrucomicrobiia bacterium]
MTPSTVSRNSPRSGRAVPEEDDPNTREVIVGNYRVIYDISGSTVRILTVLHGARLYRKSS